MQFEVSKTLTEEHLFAAQDRLNTEILPQLNTSMPDFTSEFGQNLRQGDSERKELVIQHLQDLGYLKESYLPPPTGTLPQALAKWKRDERKLSASYSNLEQYNADYPSSTLLHKLSAQVDFYANLKLLSIPPLGEITLASRIIHFRLKSLGLYKGSASDAYSSDSHAGLQTLAELLNWTRKRPLTLINAIGDVIELTKRLIEAHPSNLYIFKLPTHSEVKDDPAKPSEFEWLWQGQGKTFDKLKIIHKRQSPKQKKPSEAYFHYGKAKPDQSLDKVLNSGITKLGLQILQIRLWSLNYYQGEIDGTWGEMSLNASANFLKTHRAKNLKRFLYPLEGNLLAVNLAYVFKEILPESEEELSATGQEDLERLSNGIFEQYEKNRNWDELEATYQKIHSLEEEVFQNTSKRRRRTFGLRGLLSAVGNFFRNAARILKKAINFVIKGLKKLVGTAIRIFKYGLARVRKVIRLVGLAIKRFKHWLLEKPFLTLSEDKQHIAFTAAKRDSDSLFYVSPGSPQALISRHMRLLKQMRLAFQFVAIIALKGISIFRAAVLQNWLLVIWRIYKLLRSDFLKNFQANYGLLWQTI
ncbi:hypothetical protein MLD52_22370 [Puniceicoccaceae bacterium K14]|nr:hypothetical protein [Puniceicoccaceae bacterium K14]